jgi:hypothetical protein
MKIFLFGIFYTTTIIKKNKLETEKINCYNEIKNMLIFPQVKINWKYSLIVILGILIIVGVLIYSFEKKTLSTQKSIEIEKIKTKDKEKTKEEIDCIEVKEGSDFRNLRDIDFINKGIVYDLLDEKAFEYKIGRGKFELSKTKMEGMTMKKRDIKVYNENQEIMREDTTSIGRLWCFTFQNNRYVILTTYSGGAHCCTSNFIFFITPTNELKIIEEIITELYNITPSSLLFKSGKLYINVKGYNIGYILGSYLTNFPIELYYLIDGSKISLVISEFKEEYLKKAEEINKEVMNNGNLSEAGEAVMNYLLAGEEKKAWEAAEKFFAKFPNLINEISEKTGKKITLEDLKEEFKKEIKIIYEGLREEEIKYK